MLFKKLIRTMGQYKAQFISMIVMIALGFGVFIGANMEWWSIEKNTDRLFEETGLADYRVYVSSVVEDSSALVSSSFMTEDLEKIEGIDGVKAASRYMSVNADVSLVNGETIKTTAETKKTSRVALTITENQEVSFFNVTSGEKYDKTATDKIWLSQKYAEANDIKVGDTLTLSSITGFSSSFEFTVAGLAQSGEYLICVQDETQLMPDYTIFGFAYITPAAYEAASAAAGLPYAIYPQINVRVKNYDDFTKKAFSTAVNAALGKTTLVISKEESSSYSLAYGEVEEGQAMGAILPVIFLLIAVLTMVTTMHRIAAKEKTQIGTLKALGYKDKRILRHYSSYALFIGVVGAVLGIGIGYLIAYIIMNPSGMMATYMDMPYWKLHMPVFCPVVLIVIIALLTLIGFLSVKSMLRGTAADALRSYVPKKVKNLAIEKTKLWGRFSFGTRWNLRDIMRHKSRTLMSLIGIVGCVVIMAAALGMNDTMDAFLSDYYDTAMHYNSRIYVTETTSDEDISAITAKYDGDWSASVSVELGEGGVSLDVYSITHDNVRFLNPKGKLTTLTDDGAYICRRIADEFKLKKGSTFTVSPYGSEKTYTFKVAGIIYSASKNICITPTYAENCGVSYKIDSVYTATEKATLLSDDLTKNFEIQEKQAIIESFNTFTDLLDVSVTVLIVAACILGVVVLYNLGIMSYTERYREMATLKVVGYKDKKIAKLLIGQNMWVTVVGIIIGLPLSALTLTYMMKELASEYEMRVVMGPTTFIVSILATLAVSLLVSLLVSKKNKKIDMVEALKGAE